MSNDLPEFDSYAGSYDALLQDPIRDLFSVDGGEFFHRRKRDLIRGFFAQRKVDTSSLSYLDLGCGKGELLGLLRDDFLLACGCDPSGAMLETAGQLTGKGQIRYQSDPGRIPFEDHSFDFVTAVCVFHHVPPEFRAGLIVEVLRVLRPGGVFAIIEHNPHNPATRRIVRRTPVDAGAILLTMSETRTLVQAAGLSVADEEYFLYLPSSIYAKAGWVESLLKRLPAGGQYAVFAKNVLQASDSPID